MRILRRYSDYDLFGTSLMMLEGSLDETIEQVNSKFDTIEKRHQSQISELEEKISKLKTVKLLISHEDESNYEKEI